MPLIAFDRFDTPDDRNADHSRRINGHIENTLLSRVRFEVGANAH